MEKKTVIAVILSIVVMFTYSSYMQKHYPPKPVEQEAVSQQMPQEAARQATPQAAAPENRITFPDETYPMQSQQVTERSFGKAEHIDVGHSAYELARVGGCIKNISILKYDGRDADKPILLTDNASPRDSIFYVEGFRSVGDINAGSYDILRTDSGLLLTQKVGRKLAISKRLNFHNSLYGIELEISFQNISNAPIRDSYSIVAASNILMQEIQESRFTEGIIYANLKSQKFRLRSIKAGGNTYLGPIDVALMKNKYFSLAMKPYQNMHSATVLPARQKNDTVANTVFANSIRLNSQEIVLRPQETLTHKYLFYAGPSDIAILASYDIGMDAPYRGGVFAGLSRLLISTLKMFHRITRNYGVSIIMLTFLIALIMYPLTFKSLKSMKQMQHIQPKVDKLRRDLKDNPQKLNKEIMELYKKHKVNPFGGCLPMFLQLPIFIALYQGLSRFIGLKGAHFLWIKDLSGPDRVFMLPNSLPLIGNSINILPLMMAAAMFLQQKMSAPKTHGSHKNEGHDTMQQQQKMMSVMMPVLFGAMFYKFPSGLVLYWLTNTIIMLVQQTRIARHVHAELGTT